MLTRLICGLEQCVQRGVVAKFRTAPDKVDVGGGGRAGRAATGQPRARAKHRAAENDIRSNQRTRPRAA